MRKHHSSLKPPLRSPRGLRGFFVSGILAELVRDALESGVRAVLHLHPIAGPPSVPPLSVLGDESLKPHAAGRFKQAGAYRTWFERCHEDPIRLARQ